MRKIQITSNITGSTFFQSQSNFVYHLESAFDVIMRKGYSAIFPKLFSEKIQVGCYQLLIIQKTLSATYGRCRQVIGKFLKTGGRGKLRPMTEAENTLFTIYNSCEVFLVSLVIKELSKWNLGICQTTTWTVGDFDFRLQ